MNTPTQPQAAGDAAHTPTPWKVLPANASTNKVPKIVADLPSGTPAPIGGWGFIASMGYADGGSREANAAFIVRACNSHAALVEALETCDLAFASWQVGQIPGRPEDILALITKVRAGIAAAKQGGAS